MTQDENCGQTETEERRTLRGKSSGKNETEKNRYIGIPGKDKCNIDSKLDIKRTRQSKLQDKQRAT